MQELNSKCQQRYTYFGPHYAHANTTDIRTARQLAILGLRSRMRENGTRLHCNLGAKRETNAKNANCKVPSVAPFRFHSRVARHHISLHPLVHQRRRCIVLCANLPLQNRRPKTCPKLLFGSTAAALETSHRTLRNEKNKKKTLVFIVAVHTHGARTVTVMHSAHAHARNVNSQ